MYFFLVGTKNVSKRYVGVEKKILVTIISLLTVNRCITTNVCSYFDHDLLDDYSRMAATIYNSVNLCVQYALCGYDLSKYDILNKKEIPFTFT